MLIIIILAFNIILTVSIEFPKVCYPEDQNTIKVCGLIQSNISGLFYENIKNGSCPEDYIYTPGGKFNSIGLRDKEYSLVKSNDTFRIIVLGDSISFGSHVKNNESFPEMLEFFLNNDSEKTIEVWNAGVIGYNSMQEYVFFKEVLINYDPDLIIQQFYINDYNSPMNTYVPIMHSEEINQYCVYEATPNSLNLKKETHRFLSKHSFPYKYIMMTIYSTKQKISPKDFPNTSFKNEYGLKQVKENRNALIKTINLSKKNNLTYMLFHIPFIDKKAERDAWVVEIIGSRPDIYFLDLTNLFKSFSKEEILVDKFGHFNVKGNTIVAKEIYNYLMENEVLTK